MPLSDFDLVKLCKKQNKEAITELYTRYLPFINKKYIKFKKVFTSINIEKEDFQNDCFFAFNKAITYVNFDKITKPSTWKFLGAFMYFIDAYIWEVVRQYNRKDAHNVSLYIPTENGEDIILTDLIPELALEEGEFIENCYRKDVLQKFYSSLDSFETIVLKERSVIREKGKPKQISEIAKDLGTNFNKIQLTCKSLEKKFKAALVY